MSLADIILQEFPHVLEEKAIALTKLDFSGGDLNGTKDSWRVELSPLDPQDFRWVECQSSATGGA